MSINDIFIYMPKVYLPSSFTKCNENYGLPDFVTDYQIRHLGNPSGLPEILPNIDPCYQFLQPILQFLITLHNLSPTDGSVLFEM